MRAVSHGSVPGAFVALHLFPLEKAAPINWNVLLFQSSAWGDLKLSYILSLLYSRYSFFLSTHLFFNLCSTLSFSIICKSSF